MEIICIGIKPLLYPKGLLLEIIKNCFSRIDIPFVYEIKESINCIDTIYYLDNTKIQVCDKLVN